MQCKHALQTASLGVREDAPAALLAAALLHDVGHLLHQAGEQPALRGIDDQHEQIGADYLLPAFGPAVAEPVRLHVPAKRYLCGTDPGYYACLSPGSVRSLALQGGPFTPAQVAEFQALPYAADAVRIRRWDEAAKCPVAQHRCSNNTGRRSSSHCEPNALYQGSPHLPPPD